MPTSVAVKRVTSGSVKCEDADGARHTVGVGHVTFCAGRRKVGLDLCGELVDAGLGTYRINNNERVSDFLNAARSSSEQAYTFWDTGFRGLPPQASRIRMAETQDLALIGS